MLHALQHVKLSLPEKLIRKVISYTWLDIFPVSFNNLYCIHKFTDCTVSLSLSLSPLTHLSLAQNGHQNNLLSFPGSSQQVCPCNLSCFYCKCTIFPCLVPSFIWVRRMNHQKCCCQMLSMNYVLHCSGLLCSGFSSLLVLLHGVAFWNHWPKVWLSPKGGSPF